MTQRETRDYDRRGALMERVRRAARQKFGYGGFRPGQEEAIEAVLQGHDTLAIMPTGSGKSAIYQLASLFTNGPTVVISPLIALQKDQVESIAAHDVGEAEMVNSTISEDEKEEALEDLEDAELKFLFIAPEQFNDPETIQSLRDAKPALFVVDEAHAITEWGHDFRPEYLRLGAVIEAIGHPTVLALTATASPTVREEIMDRLAMREPKVIVEGFDRPNIWLGVERFHDERTKKEAILERVAESERPGIVYVSTRKHAEEIAQALQDQGINARPYHAGMKAAERTAVQEAFMDDEIEVIVATIAFGMGVDKPNVRFVYHYDPSGTVDAYYQEIGRAGRDGEPARAILFYRPQDLTIHRFFAGTGQVDEEDLQQVAEVVVEQRGPVEPCTIKEETGLSESKVMTAVSRLEEVGMLESSPTGEIEEQRSHTSLAKAIAAAAEAQDHHHAYEQSQIEMMRGYAEAYSCRREYLLNYFGEAYSPPCGNCDVCDSGKVAPQDEENVPFPLNSTVKHAVFGEGLVERYEGDTVTVLFEKSGYKTLDVGFVQETGALQLISDAQEM